MQDANDIFEFIKQQETGYTHNIEVNTKNWNMKKHIERSALYRDSDIVGTKTDFTPIKNITRPILNLQYRTEDIDVKDVDIYVDDPDKFHLSFLVKKYHDDVFVVENDMDTYFDQLNQSRIDFGGGLSKSLSTPCPEVVPLQSIAFCDQTDILSGPIGIKHFYSPDQLLDMASRGWGSKANGATASLEDLIALSRDEKKVNKNGVITKTPGRYIEVYEVHGNLPKSFVDSQDISGKYETRIFIVAFYQKKDSMEKFGITLYTKPEPKSPFKIVVRDPVFGRGLGFGGAEEIFEDQLWTNYDEKRMLDMKDSASKTIILSEDPAFTQRNKINNMDNNEVADVEPGKKVYQMDTFPRNFRLFAESGKGWEEHAQGMGAAQESIQGDQAPAGTAFAAIQSQIQQSSGLHDYRRGKFAKHLEEIYKDWIIPHIEKKICEGGTFLSELSLEELQYVGDALVECEAQKFEKQLVLTGQSIDPQATELFKQKVRDQFKKKGNKHFIKILKGEFKSVPLGVKVSIKGKSRNLGKASDAIVNILRFVVSTNSPALGFAGTWELVNKVIEDEGLDPMDFSDLAEGFKKMYAQQAAAPQAQPNSAQATPSPVQTQPTAMVK